MKQVPKLMKGIELIGHGDGEMLRINDSIPVPTLAKSDVLVQVLAAGVNNTDINTRIGWYSRSDSTDGDETWCGGELEFPRIQGADVCGKIVAVGENVDACRIGERVLIEPCLTEVSGVTLDDPWYFGSECNGGFAEFTAVASKHAHRVLSTLTDIELASFPCSYSTAENMLTRANVTDNDTVLITGASGGVGSAAIQLAKARGARIIALAHPDKFDQLRILGADQVFARDENLIEKLGKNCIDVVIDLVAGERWPVYLDLLCRYGRYAVAGAIGGAHVKLDVRTLYLKDLSFFGCTILSGQIFPNLVKHIEQGHILPLVAKTFSLEDIHLAQQSFLDKKYVGKIVLSIC